MYIMYLMPTQLVSRPLHSLCSTFFKCHRWGGTLDLLATFSAIDVCVDQSGVISDHGLVTCSICQLTAMSSGILANGEKLAVSQPRRFLYHHQYQYSELGMFPLAKHHSFLRTMRQHSVITLINSRRCTPFSPVNVEPRVGKFDYVTKGRIMASAER